MNNSNNKNKITLSLVISILSFILSFSTFAYNIYKDNKESITLWNLEYHCDSNNDGYIVSGSYIITNNSHKKVSIVDAYITYDNVRIPSSLDDINIFPLTLDANTSCQLSIEPKYASYYLEPSLFKINVISSKQKHYSVESKLF